MHAAWVEALTEGQFTLSLNSLFRDVIRYIFFKFLVCMVKQWQQLDSKQEAVFSAYPVVGGMSLLSLCASIYRAVRYHQKDFISAKQEMQEYEIELH